MHPSLIPYLVTLLLVQSALADSPSPNPSRPKSVTSESSSAPIAATQTPVANAATKLLPIDLTQQEALARAASVARQNLASIVRELSAGMAESAGNVAATKRVLVLIDRCNSAIEGVDKAIAPMIPKGAIK
jgi:uncharacterized membrane protein